MLLSCKKSEDLVLVLDIQSSIARSSLILISDVAKPRILFTHNTPIDRREEADSDTVINMTIVATKEAIDAAAKYLYAARKSEAEIPTKVSEVHYVLSSPWIMSHAKRVTVDFKKKTKLTKSILSSIIRAEREKMISETKAEHNAIEVEEKVFKIELNGYEVSKWQGRDADSISVSFVTSISGNKMVEKFRAVCGHTVKKHNIHFHSSLLLQHVGVSRIFPTKDTYAIIHVHGEITDVVAVQEHACILFGTYPIGVHTILRSFAKESGMDVNTAASTLKMQSTGVLEEAHNTNGIQLESVEYGWTNALDNIFKMNMVTFGNSAPFIISAFERQEDFVRILKKKYPNSRIEVLSIDEVMSQTMFDQVAERLVMVGLYAIALNTLRSK